MPSSSSPPPCPNPQPKYDVFLSFRGEDTRSNFTSHLYHALCRKKIETFIDDERVERGAELLKIIEESKISVVILSENYASSPWCLDELVQILEYRTRIGQIVVPIFYQVDPSDVRRFAEEFPKHKQHFKVERWRAALRQVANISGWHLQGNESKLVDDIVRDISKKLWKGSLCRTPSLQPKYDVYLNFRDDDTCSNFTNDLLAALKREQIKTVMKNDIFQNFRGDNIRINFTSLIHAALGWENVKTFMKDDVFQNFGGDSTRSNFISHPHAALDREKIRTFINYTVEGGAEISQTLLKRIEESKISVVIFSKDYASSPWCLDELVQILECRRTNEQIVIPIYYNVYRSDVKYQTGCFADAFAKHEVKFKDGVDKVKRWRAALKEVANLAGWPSQGPESVLVDEITREILKKLRKGSLGRSAFLNDIIRVIADVVIVSSELWGGRIRYLKQNGQDSIEGNGGKQDCISGLPDDILFSILSRLSFREGVKTSILSTRWRYLYACMPKLDFSSLTMFGLREEDHVCPRYMQKFVKLVNQFTQLYAGQNIFSFRFAFCFGREFVVDDIERWISFAIRMGVEELDINFRCKQYLPCIFYKYNYSELYTFSCQLLSEAKKLKHLHLFGCILRPSFNFKINSLKSLDLDDVPLAGREVEEILSCCSNLERLRMRKCIVPTKLYIHGPFLRLKFLTISICFGLEAVDLCAINLTLFECFSNELIKFSFSGVPNLERVFLHMNRKSGMPYIFNELPKYLPQLKTLLVRTGGEQVKYLPARITLFSNLRNFELILTTAVRIEFLKNTCILSACPLLQKFCLVTTSLSCTTDIETEEPPPCHHTQLEEVEFGGFGGSKNELNIALYFLRSAVALKRMLISRNCRIYMGSGNWEYRCRDAWNDKEREMIHRHLQGKALCGSAEVIVI